jgi:hypothetical protein
MLVRDHPLPVLLAQSDGEAKSVARVLPGNPAHAIRGRRHIELSPEWTAFAHRSISVRISVSSLLMG